MAQDLGANLLIHGMTQWDVLSFCAACAEYVSEMNRGVYIDENALYEIEDRAVIG